MKDKNLGVYMLISIIIPVYNVEKYLEQCVMSFIMQIDNNKMR